MQVQFKPGDQKHYSIAVKESDTAIFPGGQVHPVYATFALARDVEWACRLFVLDMKDEDEEGIGTKISINHVSPALKGSTVNIDSTIKTIEGNSIICDFEAKVGDRLIAFGEQGQKILKKSKIDQLFSQLNKA